MTSLHNDWIKTTVDLASTPIKLGNKKIKQRDYQLTGTIPIVDQSKKMIGGYTDNVDCKIEVKKPVIVFGDHTRIIKYVDFDFAPGADGIKILEPSDDFLPKFFYYFLKVIPLPNKGYSRHYQYLANSKILIPPIPIQEKIIRILDIAVEILHDSIHVLSILEKLSFSLFQQYFGDVLSSKTVYPRIPINQISEPNPNKSEIQQKSDNLLITFLPMEFVSNQGRIINYENKKLGDVRKKGFTYFKENDVLFAKITPCMENGKGAIAKNLKNGIGFGTTEFFVFRPKNDIVAEWLFCLLNLPHFRKFAETKMVGTVGQKRVIKEFFDLKVGVPPLPLQKKFAIVYQNIEILIQEKKQNLVNIDYFLKSLNRQTVTGNLVQ